MHSTTGMHLTRVEQFVNRTQRRVTCLDRWLLLKLVYYYYSLVGYAGSGWLGSRVFSVLDSGAEGSRFKSHQPLRCRITVLAVLGKLFTPIVHLFTKQRNW